MSDKKWKIPLSVGGVYDGEQVHFAIPEDKSYLNLGTLPNPGFIEVIEHQALLDLQKKYDELEKKYKELKFRMDGLEK